MVQQFRAVALALCIVGGIVAASGSPAGAAEPFDCGVSLQDGQIQVEIDDEGQGRWAVNLKRSNGDYVYLGRHNQTSLSLDIADGLDDGFWNVQARAIRPDGTKTARVTCGEIYLVPEFSCWAVEVEGRNSINVVSRQPFDDASLNFRDDKWIERQVPANDTTIFNSKTSRLATTVVIRQGDERYDVPCTSAILGQVEIMDQPGTTPIRIIYVLKDKVIWELGGGDFFVQNGVLDLTTNTATEIGSVSDQLVNLESVCDDRAVVLTVALNMDEFPGPGAIDAATGTLFEPGNFFYDELVVDCDAGVITAIDTDQGEPDKTFSIG